MGVERRRYVFRGRVQGVGFRATAYRLAQDHDVTGYVRNQPDGSVELVAEGDPAAIDALVSRLRQTFGPLIQRADFVTEPPGGPAASFADFTIRY
jgi:acylphosphatase